MKEKLIVLQVPIHSSQRMYHVDIHIPYNTKKIVGIQSSINMKHKPTFKDNLSNNRFFLSHVPCGMLQLKGNLQEDLFFQQSVHASFDTSELDVFKTQTSFNPSYPYRIKNEIESIDIIPTTTTLKGLYIDRLSSLLTETTKYQLHLYLHIQQ